MVRQRRCKTFITGYKICNGIFRTLILYSTGYWKHLKTVVDNTTTQPIYSKELINYKFSYSQWPIQLIYPKLSVKISCYIKLLEKCKEHMLNLKDAFACLLQIGRNPSLLPNNFLKHWQKYLPFTKYPKAIQTCID